jgi:hypothetical protein
MSKKTGRNGFILVAAIGLGLMVTSVRAGTNNFLISPASPANPASAMFTLEDVYKVLDTRTTNVTPRAGAFTEPNAGPTNGTMHTLNDIMTLVTNRAPVPKTGQTVSYVVGDDGTNRIGVAWPNPRFTVMGNTNAGSGDPLTNCIRDNLTGLIWARNANLASNTIWSADGKLTWTNAFEVIGNSSSGVVNRLNYGGTNDWRLPNVCELQSLIAWQYSSPALSSTEGTAQWTENKPFTGVQSADYWSSTPDAANSGRAWPVNFTQGAVNRVAKTTLNYVWPVRGGGQ